jgi:Ca2+-binding RTX toxin-like protein
VFALVSATPAAAAYNVGAGLADGGTTLSYLASVGESNDVTVDLVGDSYVLTDAGVASFPDADGIDGCVVSGNQATCPATTAAVSVARIRVNVSNGDDRVTINAPTPSNIFGRDGSDTLTGGPAGDTLDGFVGDDTINARGGSQDTVVCGDGNDTVVLDVNDPWTGCEQLDFPPETTLATGPPSRTANPTPEFTFFSSEDPNATFECNLDGGGFAPCSSPFVSTALADGPHAFEVRAADSAGPDATPAASGTFEVDTAAPDTAIDSGPDPESDSTSARISFIGIGPDVASFQCKLDGEDWRTCTPPASYSDLAVGTHVFSVRALDGAGNADPSEATVTFTVTSKPVQASGPPTGLIVVRPPASFVLIGGGTIRVTRNRLATVTLNCSGNRDCAGELVLTTAKKIRISKRRGSRSRRRYVRLGATTFFIPAPHSLTVKIPLSKRAFRIVRKRKRIKTTITVTDKDRAGRTRISTREVFLKASK